MLSIFELLEAYPERHVLITKIDDSDLLHVLVADEENMYFGYTIGNDNSTDLIDVINLCLSNEYNCVIR